MEKVEEEKKGEGTFSRSSSIIDNENAFTCTENAYATNKASSMPRDSTKLVNDFKYGDLFLR
jgi:hypothetical protein